MDGPIASETHKVSNTYQRNTDGVWSPQELTLAKK